MPDKEAWVIRDVDDETRQKIKRFAVDNRLTIAGALKLLVDMALSNAVNITVARSDMDKARWLQLSPELMEAMREEIRRQLQQQREE